MTTSFEEIASYSKKSFKLLVKDAVRERAFNDLLKAQKGHSKGKEIIYKELGIQSYLKASSPLTTKEKRFLFSARTRGLDLRNNFKQGQTDLRCRLCRSHLEDQPSLLTCTALEASGIEQLNYNDIFSDNLERLTATTKVLHKKYDNFILHVNRLASQPSSSATVYDNIVDLE